MKDFLYDYFTLAECGHALSGFGEVHSGQVVLFVLFAGDSTAGDVDGFVEAGVVSVVPVVSGHHFLRK